ncbi:MAG: WD40/YVTN/BNR-like repeat-containing protein, partial [Owenweeksia sp.]
MKKGILISGVSVFVLVLAVVFAGSTRTVKYYEPRETVSNNDGAQGAMQWLHKLRANQITGEVDPKDVEKAYEQIALLKSKKSSALNLQWEEMGPSTIGGRTRAILIDPNNSQIMFAGAVSGGLFKTTNGGATWQKVVGLGNPIITSLAMAPNGDMYYGTGEGMYAGANGEGSSGFRGEGVFKSTDGGATFTQLAATASWNAVGKVAVDPNNS